MKKIVNDKEKDKENKEWTASSLLYIGLNDFKSTRYKFKDRWEVTKWNCSLLWKIKVMGKLLVTLNIKNGYNCDCVSARNVGHILFECPIEDTIRKEQWQNVVREMPMGMTNSVNTTAVNEKIIYIYTCFNRVAIKNGLTFIKL